MGEMDWYVHGGYPMSVAEISSYRTPVRKLLRFFRKSRDQWKSKCQAAKQENKSLKIRLAKMTKSRNRWKVKAQCNDGYPEAEGPSSIAETKNPRAMSLWRLQGRRGAT